MKSDIKSLDTIAISIDENAFGARGSSQTRYHGHEVDEEDD
jgi:hypothetical protein